MLLKPWTCLHSRISSHSLYLCSQTGTSTSMVLMLLVLCSGAVCADVLCLSGCRLNVSSNVACTGCICTETTRVMLIMLQSGFAKHRVCDPHCRCSGAECCLHANAGKMYPQVGVSSSGSQQGADVRSKEVAQSCLWRYPLPNLALNKHTQEPLPLPGMPL